MRRTLVLFLMGLTSCAEPPSRTAPLRRAPTGGERVIAGLIEASNQWTSFRAFYELRDDSTGESALLELAYQSPGQGKIVYSGVLSTFFVDGMSHVFVENDRLRPCYILPYLEELKKAEHLYAPALDRARSVCGPLPPPGLVFALPGLETLTRVTLLQTLLTYSSEPVRLGWLPPLQAPSFTYTLLEGRHCFRRDGDGIAAAGMEVVLNSHGFIERLRVIPPSAGGNVHPGFVLTLKTLSINEPLDDRIFERPDLSRYANHSERGMARLREGLDEGVRRHLLERMARRFEERRDPQEVGGVFGLLFSIYLQQKYAPETLIRKLEDQLEGEWTAYRKERGHHLNPGELRVRTIHKFRIARVEYEEDVDRMQAQNGDYQDRLFARTVDALVPSLEGTDKRELALLWSEALKVQIDVQIRLPFVAAFEKRFKLLEEESK